MPENDLQVPRRRIELDPGLIARPAWSPFVELGLASCFSFLSGASDPVDLVITAHALGYDSIAIADVNSMAGVVRIHTEAKKLHLRPLIGCRIETVEGLAFLAYPVDRAAYGRLCQLISAGRMSTLDGEWQDKGACHISLAMLAAHAEGVQLILLPPRDLGQQLTIAVPSNVVAFPGQTRAEGEQMALTGAFTDLLPHLPRQLPTLRHLAASYLYGEDDIARINRLDVLARDHGLALLATNDVLYHLPERRPLQDVMTAIRHKTTVTDAGLLLNSNAERHLKSPREMIALFARWPHAIEATREVANKCRFSLDQLRYEYPERAYPDGLTPQAYLRRLTWQGARRRYPVRMPPRVKKTLKRELRLIGQLQLAPYFLTIKEIVDFAHGEGILCQGRGSAANSAVCYCLGITAVDPAKHQLLFERFITKERREPPDIDVDFEHERREEVIQWIYQTYGRQHAGLCATVIHYRPRMAIREVGKAMGLSEDVTSALARTVWGGHGREINEEHVRNETGLDLSDPQLTRVLKLTEQMIGMPRHLSQHVGGFILTDKLLTQTVPIGNGAMPDRTFIEWDKDDIDDLGIFKIDVLALGMLTCIRKTLKMLQDHHGQDYDLATIPQEEPAVYDMLCTGDSLGVFQVESRAQMNMLPRLQPREFYDLVVQVAIVRPGPIQGDMVHPYLKARREYRAGRRDFNLPSPAPECGPPDELSSILKRTFGVPIFQEQAMKIALDAAKFSPAEADRLRKAMATFRSRGMVHEHQDMMVGNMIARGYDPEFAHRCFNQIKGFGEYGFPESHAASFAHLVYVSSWLKCHYPAAFAAALLNSQPMGFYAPSQIVRDAEEHGVAVLPIDVNHSDWDCTLEPVDEPRHSRPRFRAGQDRWRHDRGWAVRLGLRQIDGLPESVAARLVAARQANGRFGDVREVRDRGRVPPAHVERLAAADCFGSIELPRRQALWQARTLVGAEDLPLFAAMREREEGAERKDILLPEMALAEEVVADYQTHRLSLKAHPLSFLRPSLTERGFHRADDLRGRKFRSMVQVAGVVLIRQRPGSAKGVCFITLEDESGVINLVIWPDMMEKYRKVIMGARLMEVRGRVEYDEEVIHVIAHHLTDATQDLHRLSDDLMPVTIARADHCNNPLPSRWGPGGVLVDDEGQEQSPGKGVPWQPPGPGNRDCGYHGPSAGGHPRDVRIVPRLLPLPPSRDFH
ncbi:error-prone DNA polymerase [Altererythrobacter sp. TH136]|uniref:error-prone DNA polymerase n=1 Tax=Altererythrobacter sp. TH136 TaxID=2067415 RepID=UPI00116484D7|nr:error-prone DNA polymerase [Altererythrobacter sp. TH136]QDM39842.1 DNA polymerase III subunit alpha [Altererythrobacter sp. TH136]